MSYSFRPLKWLELEAGFAQLVHPVGDRSCCEYLPALHDELYLVPFGARYVLRPGNGRVGFSVGGGGAWYKHSLPDYSFLGFTPVSTWGAQFVGSVDYAITKSGRYRAGVTARYYYVPAFPEQKQRVVTFGPQFTFSFH